ncbi:MAG: GDSL-type esterase/lipase family protein [Verrucomicrobiota bacterium]
MTANISRLFLAILLATGPGTTMNAADTPTLESMYQDAPKGLPSEPAWGYWKAAPTSWMIVHQQFVNRSKQGNVDIVFLGDSITKGWQQTESTNWTDSPTAIQTVNYGIGGDTTRQVIWRINDGELDGIKPKLVVLMIGTNNLYADHNSGTNEQIVDGVKTILGLIREKSPDTRILLLGVLPRQTKFWSDRVLVLNGLLAALDAPGRVKFHDAGARFIGEDGEINKELFNADLVHLNAAGYENLTTIAKPLVKSLLQ